jgi:23S rRNA pseudouridine1911/1915/1917 synthase
MDLHSEQTEQVDIDKHYPPKVDQEQIITVPAGQTPIRLDSFLSFTLPNASRTRVQQAIESHNILVNDKPAKPSRKVQPNDIIFCRIPRIPPLELLPEDISLDIVFEDEKIIIVNKPAGMVVHPGVGNRYGTLVNGLLWHMGVRESQSIEQEQSNELHDDNGNEIEADEEAIDVYRSDAVRPGLVHRIDKDTSGILVIAKDPETHEFIARQFAERTTQRRYVALAWGSMKDDIGTIQGNIGRSPSNRKAFTVVRSPHGKPAVTHYEVLERFDFLTLLKLRLETGRTHQIRVHCKHIKHPLFSDAMYGGDKALYSGVLPKHKQRVHNLMKLLPRQALHAKSLAFEHPNGQWMEFDSPLPEDIQAVLTTLRESQSS